MADPVVPQCQLNDLTPDRFLFKCDVLPNIHYRLISAPIPGLTISNQRVGARARQPFIVPGHGIDLSPLTMIFVIDEDVNNWLEAMAWVQKVANADDITAEGIMGNASLVALDSSYNSVLECHFQDCVAQTLGDIDLNVTEDLPYTTSSLTIEFSSYRLIGKSFETDWL